MWPAIEEGFRLAAETAFFASLLPVTAPLRSWRVPTLPAGMAIAAYEVPPNETKSESPVVSVGGSAAWEEWAEVGEAEHRECDRGVGGGGGGCRDARRGGRGRSLRCAAVPTRGMSPESQFSDRFACITAHSRARKTRLGCSTAGGWGTTQPPKTGRRLGRFPGASAPIRSACFFEPTDGSVGGVTGRVGVGRARRG